MLSTLLNLIFATFAAISQAQSPAAAITAPPPPPPPVISTIAGTPVPYGLSCEEDEYIALLPSPYARGIDYDAIGCVHIDAL